MKWGPTGVYSLCSVPWIMDALWYLKFQHQRVEQCVPSWQNCGSGSHKLNGSETQQSSCRSWWKGFWTPACFMHYMFLSLISQLNWSLHSHSTAWKGKARQKERSKTTFCLLPLMSPHVLLFYYCCLLDCTDF